LAWTALFPIDDYRALALMYVQFEAEHEEFVEKHEYRNKGTDHCLVFLGLAPTL
jgi:hypothetical protein